MLFRSLKEFIKKNNLKKIILLENISYQLWFSLLKKAFAGFALYKPINVSHKLMGGTSQKLNNYIFAGIPSIVSKSEDILKFNKMYSTSIITNNSPKDRLQDHRLSNAESFLCVVILHFPL